MAQIYMLGENAIAAGSRGRYEGVDADHYRRKSAGHVGNVIMMPVRTEQPAGQPLPLPPPAVAELLEQVEADRLPPSIFLS